MPTGIFRNRRFALTPSDERAVRSRALRAWRSNPLRDAVEIAREITRDLFHDRTAGPIEMRPDDVQQSFFRVLAVVAVARVEFLDSKDLRGLVAELARFVDG